MSVLFKTRGFEQFFDGTDSNEQNDVDKDPILAMDYLKLLHKTGQSLCKWVKYSSVFFLVLQVVFIVALTGFLVTYGNQGTCDNNANGREKLVNVQSKKEGVKGTRLNEATYSTAEMNVVSSSTPTTVATVPPGKEAYEHCGCRHYLVSGKYGVRDDQLSASSKWDYHHVRHGPERSRLYKISDKTSSGTGAWSARTNDNQQYIQVKLANISRITGIVTQGRREVNQWVTSYKVLYSTDGNTWKTVQDELTEADQEFAGNSDRNTLVTNQLNCPILARFVRVQPQTWFGHVSMRFDVLGYPDD